MLIEFLKGYAILILYFLICASIALAIRKSLPVAREVFRKTLHFILLGSIFVLLYAYETWWISALASLIFMAMVYPILKCAEKIPGYSELLTERKSGEIKRSLVVVFCMFSALICLCWGWLGDKLLVLASVLAWGFGDAAAALVGVKYGKRYIEGKMVEGRKSLEGTLAMFIVSFITVLVVLLVRGSVKWYGYIPTAAITAGVCSLVELYTKGGMDTITCPFAAVAILIPLISLWGV